MSTLDTTLDDYTEPCELEYRLPIVSAADVNDRIEVEFDQYQSQMLKEEASRRRLSSSSTPDRDHQNHLMGLASEVAVATWRGGNVDRRILDDYEGDGGVDVIEPRKDRDLRFQVKSTRSVSNPKRIITQDEVDRADIFVLCRTTAPDRLIKIIGYICRYQLESINTVYGRNGYVLRPDILHPVGQQRYGPDDVRRHIQQ